MQTDHQQLYTILLVLLIFNRMVEHSVLSVRLPNIKSEFCDRIPQAQY